MQRAVPRAACRPPAPSTSSTPARLHPRPHDSVLGQSVDLTPLRGVLQPVSAGLSGILSTVGGIIKGSPDLSFPLPGAGASSSATWLLTTYLDEDTRITR